MLIIKDNNGALNVQMIAGEDLVMPFTFTQADGTPLNLGGYSFKATIAFPTPFSLTPAISIVSAGTGQAKIDTGAASISTAAWPTGSFDWDLWWVDPSSNELRVFFGRFFISQGVTPP